MNRYRVDWQPNAIDAIAEIWLAALDRRAIAEACNAAEQLLAVLPAERGKPLHEGLRKIVVGPLAIIFSVDADERLVLIEGANRR